MGVPQGKTAMYPEFPTAEENKTDEQLKAIRPG